MNFLSISSLHLKIASFTHLLLLYLTFTMILALIPFLCSCCSVAKLCLTLCDPMDCTQHIRLSCPSLCPRVCSHSCPSRSCHPTISFSVVPFSSCLQSFPEPGSFPMNRLFTSGGQSIAASYSASVLPMNLQG